MDVYDEQTTTMRVRWEKVDDASGYMLLASAVNATQPTIDQEVGENEESSCVTEWKGPQPSNTCMCLWTDMIGIRTKHKHAAKHFRLLSAVPDKRQISHVETCFPKLPGFDKAKGKYRGTLLVRRGCCQGELRPQLCKGAS